MASSLIGALRVALGLDTASFEDGKKRVSGDAKKLGRDIEKGIGDGAKRADTAVARSLSSITSRLKGLAAGFITLQAAKQLLGYADAAKSMTAQLKLATSGFGAFGQAQEDVRRISVATRGGIEETTKLYGNFLRASEPLGKSQADAARATETFSKALTLGGANAAEAGSATLQFGQALASGALRGDEFNSIAEASPRIMRLLADSLGVTTGKLREMAADGKLTSDVLYRALTDRKFTSGIDAEFAVLPVTFDQAMGQIHNAAVLTFGAFDEGGEFSTALANFALGGAGDIGKLEDRARDFGITVRAELDGLGSAFSPFVDAGRTAFSELTELMGRFTSSGKDQIENLLLSADQLLNIGPAVANFFGANGKYDSHLLDRYRASKQASQESGEARVAAARLNGRIGFGPGSITADDVSLAKRYGGGRAVTPAHEQSKEEIAAAKKAARDKQRAAEKADRDDRAFQADLSRSRLEYLSAQADLTADQAARAAIAKEQIEVDRAARASEIETDKNLTAARKEQLSALNDQIAATRQEAVVRGERERLAQDALSATRADNDNQTDLLNSQEALARTSRERRDIQLRILNLQFDMERATLEAVLASQQSSATEKAIAQQRLDLLGALQSNARAGVINGSAGPLAQYLDEIPRSAAEANEAFEAIAANGLDDLNSGIADAIAGASSLGDAFSRVSDQIISDLVRIAVQQAIIKPLGNALAGMFGGSAGVDGATSAGVNNIGKIIAGARAGGGPVSAGKNYLVGEMGPEIFTPRASGQIVANDDIRAGGGLTINQTFAPHLAGSAVDRAELMRFAAVVKQDTIATFRDMKARGAA